MDLAETGWSGNVLINRYWKTSTNSAEFDACWKCWPKTFFLYFSRTRKTRPARTVDSNIQNTAFVSVIYARFRKHKIEIWPACDFHGAQGFIHLLKSIKNDNNNDTSVTLQLIKIFFAGKLQEVIAEFSDVFYFIWFNHWGKVLSVSIVALLPRMLCSCYLFTCFLLNGCKISRILNWICKYIPI